MTTITLSAGNLTPLITLTPPTQYISVNGTQTDCTNLYNLSTQFKSIIDGGGTSLSFGDAYISTYLQYVSSLQTTSFTLDQLNQFIQWANQYQFINQIFINVYTGLTSVSSPVALDPYGTSILANYLTNLQLINLAVYYLQNSSLTQLTVPQYLVLFSQIYFSGSTLTLMLGNQNFSEAEKVTLIAGARANGNLDSFTSLVIDNNGNYYFKKQFLDSNVTNGVFYYFINLSSFTVTVNALPSGASEISVVTALSKSQYQTLLTSVVGNAEGLMHTMLYCVNNQGITIS